MCFLSQEVADRMFKKITLQDKTIKLQSYEIAKMRPIYDAAVACGGSGNEELVKLVNQAEGKK